jgi:tetratricopeptide (TPR) repeat protein
VDDIIAGCARLPLALAIAAARAATRPGFPLAAIAAELREATTALGAFHGGDAATDVRAVFSWSHRTLSTGAARLFRLLGLHPGPDISAPAAASLTGVPLEQARTLLTELARAHMLSEDAPGRFAFHDLLRAYATELAGRHESAAAVQAAVHRVLDHYLLTASSAALLLNPTRDPFTAAAPQPGVVAEKLTGYQQALDWFTAERSVLLAAVEQAPAGFDTYTWQIAAALTTFLDRRGYWHEQHAAHTAALAAARRRGDRTGQACAHRGLGLAYAGLERFNEAHVHYMRALGMFSELGNHVGQAQTYQNLSRMSGEEGRHLEAIDHSKQSLAHFQAAGLRAGQASAVNNIGWHLAQLEDYGQALAYCEQALAIHEELGDLNGQAHTSDSLGYIHRHLGHHQQAIMCYRHALELFRVTGDRLSEAIGLAYLGDTHHAVGSHAAARQAWQQALEILDKLNHPGASQVRAKLAADGGPLIRTGGAPHAGSAGA